MKKLKHKIHDLHISSLSLSLSSSSIIIVGGGGGGGGGVVVGCCVGFVCLVCFLFINTINLSSLFY